ncbi:MAG TPA: hypothetical protein DHV67_01925 [Gallionella sp.]|nr:hypothetical protein [Gallionella sp.]
MGVMIDAAESYAMLRDVASGKSRMVQKGQTINGILVQSMEPERVTLTQYDDAEVITLKLQPSPKVTQPARVSVPHPTPVSANNPRNSLGEKRGRAARQTLPALINIPGQHPTP